MSTRHLNRRYQLVDMEPMDDSSDNSNQTWLQDGLNSMQLKRSEMNELIMDYLVHEGFKDAAKRFKEEAGIEPASLRLGTTSTTTSMTTAPSDGLAVDDSMNQKPEVGFANNNNNSTSNSLNSNNTKKEQQIQQQNPMSGGLISVAGQVGEDRLGGFNDWLTKVETTEMIDKRIEVRQSIEGGEILRGQLLINQYYPELLDNHKNLYFKLQQQHLIELIRQQKINDVLSYVHDKLSVDELSDLTEMERTLALLAYEHPDKSPYAGLLQTSHRLQLASEINDIILQETTGNVEPTKPRLVTLLKLLFWTQSELERKKIQFPKMTDLVNGTIVEPRH